jgi:hypothetical protein
MLDTIILQLKKQDFSIHDYGKFRTTAEEIRNAKEGFRKWTNNPTAEDRKKDIYKPRLTLIKRGLNFFLKIEFSAPKLLFNNNLDELEESDFNNVVNTLRDKLKDMGVWVWTKAIQEAEILSFHPSKNIILSNRQTANLVIRELRKADFSKRFDLDEKEYRNGCEVMQFYTKSHSLVIYDKINDLTKRPKRAIDKDQTIYQLSLFDFVKEERKELEIIRIEIRLSEKRKMNEILEEAKHKPNPLLKDIFKKDLCQKIVNLYWNEFFNKNLFLYAINKNPQEVLKIILMKNPKMKITTAIKLVGFYQLCKDEEGMKGFRQVVDSYKPKTNWLAVKRDLKTFQDEIFNYPTFDFMKEIRTQLKNFNSFKIKG